MRLSNIFYSIGAAGLLALGNSAFAAVYNFGNIQTGPTGYTIQGTNFSGDDAAASINFDSSPGPLNQTISNLMTMNRVVYASVNNDIDLRKKFSQRSKRKYYKDNWVKKPPVTSPVPEPETYAMILAGLGLIIFTARNRKQDV